MLLGVPNGLIEEVEHLGLLILEMVSIHLKFPLDLELLALESRIDSIR